MSASESTVRSASARDDVAHHANPIDALLASYSAGELNPALRALVASHLAMSVANRPFVAALDNLAGSELDAIAPIPLSDRDRRLDAIFAANPTVTRQSTLPATSDLDLPTPLHTYLGTDLSDLKWKTLMPGVREAVIERKGRGEVKILWAKGGRHMPRHSHEGSEVTLVVKGAFRDKTGVYRKGDMVIAETDLNHQPITEPGEDCICFAVTDAPISLSGPIGWLLNKFMAH